MIEFAKQAAKLGLSRFLDPDARGRQSVKNSELLLAQPFIDTDREVWFGASHIPKSLRSVSRSNVRTAQDNVWLAVPRTRGKPAAQRIGLLLS
jgi:hypothetical protein